MFLKTRGKRPKNDTEYNPKQIQVSLLKQHLLDTMNCSLDIVTILRIDSANLYVRFLFAFQIAIGATWKIKQKRSS